MSSLVKGMLLGAAAATVLVGAAVPFGETKESLYDRLMKKDEK